MLELNSISKTFKDDNTLILNDINLKINDGEIVGLLGKNGAGKTTLMKIIAKTKKPSSGTVYINKKDIFKDDNMLKDVGIMIDTVHYEHLSAEQNLLYFLKVNNQLEYIKNINKILKLVGLLETKNKKVKNYSFGMKQRLSLAMCLVTEPNLAIMDEPFVGLDPNGVNSLISSLKKWVKKRNISLLISSHQLSELEEVCNRFVILKNSKLYNISLNKDTELKILVSKPISIDDATTFMVEFPIITNIKDNVIYVSKETNNFNELLQTIIKKYSLIRIEENSKDLYNIFDDFENEGVK
ncbi:ABC transporter ATP-binding protein [Staphylococcus hominis]